MDKRFNFIDEDMLQTLIEKKAKPEKSVLKHTQDLVEVLDYLKDLGYIKDKRIINLTEYACIYHDFGKINSEFQNRVTGKQSKFNEEKEVAHNILSLYFIDKNNFESEKEYLNVAHSVLNHHNYCNVYEIINDKKELIQELLKDYKTIKVKRSTLNKLSEIIEDNDSIIIKGYLHKCDYSASSGNIAEYRNDFLEGSLSNLLDSWKKFSKDAEWNKLQKFCVEHREENIIAIAQTGMGKTEGGLLWIGNNKGFFVLPIRTAINAIYDRVRVGILNNKNIDERIAILHSNSLEYYMKNVKFENEDIDLMKYHKIGKQLSIPVNISTMDQLFDFVFKYQGFELKATTLSYSKIVIDEIQAYGPDLLAYLIIGLEKIVELGGKIAILTATLPPFIKDLLSKNINFKEGVFTNGLKRHNLKVLNKRINSEDIYKKYNKNKELNKHNKVLVVCNTIKEAQKLYEELRDLISQEELKILHSKFTKMDRLKRENEIIDFGKTFNNKNEIDKQNGIWISTSIVEASLDIDFDYLFTELQELNSLFQRLGRCNRKGKKDAIDYNCFIYTEIDEKNLTNGDKGFIDRTLYELSKEAINSCDGAISEDEKLDLINMYLTTERLRGSHYMTEYKKIYKEMMDLSPYKMKIKDIDLRNILSEEIIPSPIYEKYLAEIRDIENELLNNHSLSAYERIVLKDKIRKYTLSVHPNDINNYKRGLSKGVATPFSPVKIGDGAYEYIEVIECEYDEIGYRKADYKNSKSNSIIF